MTAAERLRRIGYPLVVLLVNVAVAWRLFRTEYIDQLPSIEGAFLSLATYIRHHWPLYDWFPMWYGGFPFTNAYQPLFHYMVAVASAVSGATPARAYHFVAGAMYALGGVAFYCLVRVLTKDRNVSLLGALVYSVFSPSLFFAVIRQDAGGLWHPRRLQAMVGYGEGPNVTGLTLGIFALAALIAALHAPRGPRWLLAAVALAAVPATSWPATVALGLAVLCYLAALHFDQWKVILPRLAIIAVTAFLLVLPFALPSTIRTTFHNANVMGDGPTLGSSRWLALALILFCCAAVRFLSSRLATATRFALLYATLFIGIVLTVAEFDIRVLPQAMRFHLAMEIAIVLTVTLLVAMLPARLRKCAAIAVVIFSCIQTYYSMKHARGLIRPLKVTDSLEYQEAEWLDANMNGARVAVPGTVSFWMNAFTETPQLTGCCEQSVLSHENVIAAYITGAGFEDPQKSADFSLLWLKAYGINAVGIGGPKSREAYKAFQFPSRFEGRIPLVWREGDDSIYRIPQRTTGLARVVPQTALVVKPPENGIDDVQLRPFVAALDDPGLPVAQWRWNDADSATVLAKMTPDQALSIAVNYHPGWSATVGGHGVPLTHDGMDLITVRPGCNGDCRVELHWSPGVETRLAWPLSLLTLAVGIYFTCGRAARS